jgi:phosphoserine phosphatase RsbU/P
MTQTTSTRRPTTGEAPPRKERVLVVDDNAGTRYHVTRVLRREGFTILEADSGASALRMAAEHAPDLIILDVKMPDMLGFEVCERLRADPAYANVSIMHLSATYTDGDARAYGLGKGADAYLTHPVEPQVLLATVNALLRLQRSERRLADLLEREQIARMEAERALAAVERTEQALQLSQRRMLRLSESGIVGLVYWEDYGKRVIDANDTFLRMVGYTRDDLERGLVNVNSLTPPQWAATTKAVVEELRRTGISAPHEKQWIRKDGSLCDVLIVAANLEEQGGILLVVDTTSRKRAENERGRLLEELEQSLRARDEFLAMATHDLRSPLGAVQLKLDLLAQLAVRPDPGSQDEAKRQIGLAQKQIDQIGRMLDQLLDASRMRFGQLPIQWESVDLGKLVTQTTERMADQIHAAGCELTLDIEDNVTGTWDHIRLDQVITNLLSNAIKYGAGNPVGIKVSSDGDLGRLDIIDNGPGIDPEDQARMFSAFQRGNTAGGKGFGLGLWIVHRIVDALGGQVWGQSGPKTGSTFTVTLPRSRQG